MSADEQPYRPRWLLAAPFLGRPPALTRRQWRVIGLVAFVTMFDQYDLSLFSLALKQIQAGLAIPEADLGRLGAIVRLGALPAFLLTIAADRLGRRRVLVFTIAGYTLLTGATAFAPNAAVFVALQFLARTFAVAEVLLAYVVISEEVDAEHRGWAIGALASLSACGVGLASIAFSAVNLLSWKGLYLIGLGPLLLLTWLRRSLPETGRFEAQKEEISASRGLPAIVRPVLELVRRYPGRFIATASIAMLLNMAGNPAGFFAPKYFQDVHGWSPGEYSLLMLGGGFIGIFGSAYAGRLSDRLGRRPVAIVFFALHPFLEIGYYQSSGWLLAPLWIAALFAGIGGDVMALAFANEIFPTSYRSTASGARSVLATLGGVLGLTAESALYEITGSHWMAVSYLSAFALITPIIVAAALPETSRRQLEEISP